MRPKSLLLLALALGCGLVASIGISQVMDRNSQPHAALETTPIYVAKHNINIGDPIAESMLSLQAWPKDRVPKGAIATLEELEGRRPRTAIIEGEPILDAKLLAKGQIADPIRSIATDMRMKTISVNAETSAAGLLGPGDRVDVHLYVKADPRNNIPHALSKVILQNIRVFAVDQSVQRSSADGSEERTTAKTVSLMVTPAQASKLTLAERLGEISLVPRNPDDEKVADDTTITAADLLSVGEAGSRAKEQNRDDVPDVEPITASATSDLATVVSTAVQSRPPVTMEIVERDAVRVVMFDPDTLKPIRDASPATSAAGPMLDSSSPGLSPEGAAGGTPTADPQKMLDEFPIDFGAKN
jgi:pilus assembly protein CpaB